MSAKASAVARVEVVGLRPLLMRDRDAAAYLGRSPSWIRAKRAEDTRTMAEELAPTGPKWIVIDRSIFYRLEDLDQWVASHPTERGVISFSNRGAEK